MNCCKILEMMPIESPNWYLNIVKVVGVNERVEGMDRSNEKKTSECYLTWDSIENSLVKKVHVEYRRLVNKTKVKKLIDKNKW